MTKFQTNKLNVGIIDYGLGNLFSVQRVVNKLGGNGVITWDSKILESCDRLILPGVGAFADGMDGLKERNLIQPIYSAAEKGVPILGICLGMQLLMSSSEEFGLHKGLDLIKGSVIGLKPSHSNEEIIKIPHIGWNSIMKPKTNTEKKSQNLYNAWDKDILGGLRENSFVYFIHSYFVLPENSNYIKAQTTYGINKFCSVISIENVKGCQFHPERSGELGIKIYKNFLFN
jgi:glutamine amidotransferase